MDVIDSKTAEELHVSMLAELAKAKNELSCAMRDIDKASSRLNFLIVVANNLINRTKD